MSYSIEYYQTEKGKSPVIEWRDGLEEKHKKKVIQIIGYLEDYGFELKEPFVKHIKDKIYELRTRFSNNQFRILYFAFTGKTFVLLHGFTKKTQKIHQKEIEIAEIRMVDYIERSK